MYQRLPYGRQWARSTEELPISQDSQPLSEVLRERARDAWDRALAHRFFAEAEAGTLDAGVFARYLEVERDFVGTAARSLGLAVASADTPVVRKRLAAGLRHLTDEQDRYFAEVTGEAAPGGPPPSDGLAAPLHRHFLACAWGGELSVMLGCMLGAEWLYLTWCTAAYPVPAGPDGLAEWVALHVGGEFREHVEWLRATVDSLEVDEAEEERMLGAFRGTLLAEIPFHSAAYPARPA